MNNLENKNGKGEKPKKQPLQTRRTISILTASALVLAIAISAIAKEGAFTKLASAAGYVHPRDKIVQEVALLAAPNGIEGGNEFISQALATNGNGAGISPIYDPFHRIVKIVETTGGTVTSTKQFVWAGDQLCEERDAVGTVTRRFFADGEQIAGTNYYYTRDHLGSVRELTDGGGNVVAALCYDPYGRTTKLGGNSVEPSFGYAGMYLHSRSGLNLTPGRPYSATLGRFISRDPAEEEGSQNLYSYVDNDPVDFIDPTGLDKYLPHGDGAGGVGNGTGTSVPWTGGGGWGGAPPMGGRGPLPVPGPLPPSGSDNKPPPPSPPPDENPKPPRRPPKCPRRNTPPRPRRDTRTPFDSPSRPHNWPQTPPDTSDWWPFEKK